MSLREQLAECKQALEKDLVRVNREQGLLLDGTMADVDELLDIVSDLGLDSFGCVDEDDG